MYDISDWRDLLDTPVTSAEELSSSSVDSASTMNRVGEDLGLSVHIMRGKIETVMRSGRDMDGAYPPLSAVGTDGYRYFNYDVVNLDFDGGLGSVFERHEAISELLLRQSRIESILLITFNVRSKLQAAVRAALHDLRGRLGSPEAETVLQWYEADNRLEAYRIKAVVPGIIMHGANAVNLDCRAYPPVIYDGKRAKLVHFAFHLAPHVGVFRGFAHQSEAQLLALPILYVKQGELELDAVQAPDFSLGRAREELSFLGSLAVTAVMNRYAQGHEGV